MERNFNNEFERFLKENADQYRMYPSSKVWNGIYSTLHTRRKWFGLGIILLLITGSLVAILVTHSSKETALTNNIKSGNAVKETSMAPSTAVANTSIATTNSVVNSNNHSNQDLAAVNSYAAPGVVNSTSELSRQPFSTLPVEQVSAPSFGTSTLSDATVASSSGNVPLPIDVNVTDQLTDQDILSTPLKKAFEYPKSLNTPSAFNWTIESVLNSFSNLRKDRKFSLQLNLTPTVSYRHLSSNKSFLASTASTNAPSYYAPLFDINSVVTHKPDLGLEFGLTSKYAVSNRLKVKAGLQFNINRYDIKAFNSSYEVAKIDLRGSRGVDSFLTLSTHRNFNGYKSDWLQNFYFEISLPVGLEMNLVGDDKVHFGIAGTIQPTYVLGERAYLLSTDYKNYALVPWLIRRWNVSTGFETFVSYSTGKMRWQVGPQVRYQLLSSFIDKYPVKENLFDFGLKVGVSLIK